MRPDPSIAARLLRLPIEWRVRLWEASKPGSLGWGVWDHGPIVRAMRRPDVASCQGWAWYPSDSAAWMRATGCPDWSIDCQSGEVVAVLINHSDPMKDWIRASTAEECALSWFEAGPLLAPDP